ncbi:hypothetical protein Tco_0481053 [Tanacetum coccineum]
MVKILGNGVSTSMWLDNWARTGPIINHVTYMYTARIDILMWPNEWRRTYTNVVNTPVPYLKSSESDKIRWKNSNGRLVKLSVKSVLEDISVGMMNVISMPEDWNEIIQELTTLPCKFGVSLEDYVLEQWCILFGKKEMLDCLGMKAEQWRN